MPDMGDTYLLRHDNLCRLFVNLVSFFSGDVTCGEKPVAARVHTARRGSYTAKMGFSLSACNTVNIVMGYGVLVHANMMGHP